jgi:coenzyme F420-0:L-glutamate ligase / coenzyme F420-1:gamma-L-glutamate ligase
MSDALSFTAFAIPNIPMIQANDNLPQIILKACEDAAIALQAGDVLVISSKIVSKSEGQIVKLADVTPDATALELSEIVNKDPRIVQLILQESRGISRKAQGVLVTEHRLGFVSANSGIDQSNVGIPDSVLLLPKDPDESARRICNAIHTSADVDVAIIISDTHGRPFRMGNVGVAIGIAGMLALDDKRGTHDLFGRELVATVQGYADMIASAAHLLCGEGAEGRPVIVLRGLDYPAGDGHATDLNRPMERDLYR